MVLGGILMLVALGCAFFGALCLLYDPGAALFFFALAALALFGSVVLLVPDQGYQSVVLNQGAAKAKLCPSAVEERLSFFIHRIVYLSGPMPLRLKHFVAHYRIDMPTNAVGRDQV